MEMKFRWIKDSTYPYSKTTKGQFQHMAFLLTLLRNSFTCCGMDTFWSLEEVILLLICIPIEKKKSSYLGTQSQQRNVSVGGNAVSVCAVLFTQSKGGFKLKQACLYPLANFIIKHQPTECSVFFPE